MLSSGSQKATNGKGLFGESACYVYRDLAFQVDKAFSQNSWLHEHLSTPKLETFDKPKGHL